MATLVGKVGMVMKGGWSSSATYEVLDAVSYNNGLYVAKQAVPANTVPTNTTYWQSAVLPPFYTKINIPAGTGYTESPGVGVVDVFGGNNGTSITIKQYYNGADRTVTHAIGSNSFGRILVCPTDEINFTGGPYAGAVLYYIATSR